MAVINTNLVCDLQKAVKVEYIDGVLFSQDNQANKINVTVLDGGEPATISGTVSANIIRSDGGTVAASGGSITGNVASITLPAAAYAVPGVVSIVVKLTASGVITTIAAVVANMYRASTDTAVDPGTIMPSIQTLISQINAAVASIPADYSSLWTKLAPAFSTDASYVAGQYVTNNSGLYRFNTTHTGDWSSSDVTAVNLGGEITNLKSALTSEVNNIEKVFQNDCIRNLANPADFVVGYAVNQTNGTFFKYTNGARTGYIPVVGGLSYCFAAYNNGTGQGFRYAFYDDNKTFLEGAVCNYFSDVDYLLIAPTKARYIAFSTLKDQFPVMIAQSETAKPYTIYNRNDKLDLDTIPSISPAQADFMNNIVNLVDPNDCVSGYFVNQTNGNFYSSTNQTRTDYIEIEPFADYCILALNGSNGQTLRYALYDASKVYITGAAISYSASGHIIKTHPYAKYIALSIDTSSFPMCVSKNSTLVPFAPYGYDNKTIKNENLPGIDFGKADFIVKPNNLIDPSSIVVGEFINPSNGEYASGNNYSRTGHIQIEPLHKYCITPQSNESKMLYAAFYDENDVFISNSGISATLESLGFLVTSPATAKYIALSLGTTDQLFMLSLSDIRIQFHAYGDTTPYLPYENLGKSYSNEHIILNLAPKTYCLVGYETNIYFENLTDDWEQYTWDCTCYKGQQWERGFRYIPISSDVSASTLLQITATDKNGISKTASTILVTTATNAGSGTTKSVIVLGDSTTNNGTVIVKLHENFSNDSMSIETLGTRGTAPNNHEGRSGWTFAQYFAASTDPGVDNPFYNPSTQTFDADYYFTETGIEKPDWFFINLGINDTFNFASDEVFESGVGAIITKCNAMIASVLDATTSTKIGLCITIPPNDSQDAFGKAYGCFTTRDRYKRTNALWAKKLIETYSGKEAQKIYLIPIHQCLDTVYNMGLESIPVNSRNTMTYESAIGNGGVHPAESGYWQIADVYTAFLKAQ